MTAINENKYKDAIVLKMVPIKKVLPGNKVSATAPVSATATPLESSVDVNKQILERQKHMEDLMTQYNQSVQAKSGPETDEDGGANENVAVDFFLKMVKTYFALVLKFGDTVANTVIRMTMPAQIADPIISDTPLNVADLIKTADRVNQVLANPGFKAELGHMFENTSNAVNPQIKMLLNKMADVVMEVAGKTGSKLASTAAISLSAFPPFAVAFDIANLISVGINVVSSGMKVVSTVATGTAKTAAALNSTPGVDFNKYLDKTVAPPTKGPTPAKGPPPVVKKGGSLAGDIGQQLLVDTGGQKYIEPVVKIEHKVENAIANLTSEIQNQWDKITRTPSEYKSHGGGAKKTRRVLERIQKTYDDYNKTNKHRKTKRTR
jgi:hypothetical protein